MRVISVLVAALLCSCEGNTFYRVELENLTDDTLQVDIRSSFDDMGVDTQLAPGAMLKVVEYDVLGGIEEPGTLEFNFSQFEVFNESGEPLLKDFRVLENWSVASEQTNKAPSNWEHFYLMEIERSDF